MHAGVPLQAVYPSAENLRDVRGSARCTGCGETRGSHVRDCERSRLAREGLRETTSTDPALDLRGLRGCVGCGKKQGCHAPDCVYHAGFERCMNLDSASRGDAADYHSPPHTPRPGQKQKAVDMPDAAATDTQHAPGADAAAVCAEDYECVLCLRLLFEPVTLRCGHSFCLHCCAALQATRHAKCPSCRRVLPIHGDASDMVRTARERVCMCVRARSLMLSLSLVTMRTQARTPQHTHAVSHTHLLGSIAGPVKATPRRLSRRVRRAKGRNSVRPSRGQSVAWGGRGAGASCRGIRRVQCGE